MSIRIVIETIPHSEQRYETVGDYWIGTEGTWHIRVSKMNDWRKEIAIAVHELVEMSLCRDRGISHDEITDFDKQFEARRVKDNVDEPGDDPQAPYQQEHCFATGIERLLIAEFGLAWKEYDDAVNAL